MENFQDVVKFKSLSARAVTIDITSLGKKLLYGCSDDISQFTRPSFQR